MNRGLPIAGCVLGAIMVAGVVVIGHRNETQAAKPPAGPVGISKSFKRFAAPALGSRTLTGAPFSLRSLRGRPAVINFWASWCSGCRSEAGQLARASKRLGSQAAFIGVDVTDHKKSALRFARSHGWRYPLVPDGGDTIAIRYGVVGLPTTVFVDSRGVVVDRIVGPTNAHEIEQMVRALSRA
jgi:thiol-disulfide isomerase/thioredoxin